MNINNELIQLDRNLLEGYIESLGIDVVKRMFALYKQQAAIYLEDIENSLREQNADLWQEHCHKMKGAAGSVGLKALHSRLKLLEKTTADMDEKTHLLAELKMHNQQAMAEFNAWIEGL